MSNINSLKQAKKWFTIFYKKKPYGYTKKELKDLKPLALYHVFMQNGIYTLITVPFI